MKASDWRDHGNPGPSIPTRSVMSNGAIVWHPLFYRTTLTFQSRERVVRLPQIRFENIDVRFVNVLVSYMEVEADTDRAVGLRALMKIGVAIQHGFCGLALDSAIDAALGLFFFESGSPAAAADLFVRPHGEGGNA